MKELSRKEGKSIRLYSFETPQELNSRFHRVFMDEVNTKILFSGTKTELLSKPEEFWSEIVYSWDQATGGDDYQDYYRNYLIKNYDDYLDKYHFTTAKESGISSLEGEKEFVIICEESV